MHRPELHGFTVLAFKPSPNPRGCCTPVTGVLTLQLLIRFLDSMQMMRFLLNLCCTHSCLHGKFYNNIAACRHLFPINT